MASKGTRTQFYEWGGRGMGLEKQCHGNNEGKFQRESSQYRVLQGDPNNKHLYVVLLFSLRIYKQLKILYALT